MLPKNLESILNSVKEISKSSFEDKRGSFISIKHDTIETYSSGGYEPEPQGIVTHLIDQTIDLINFSILAGEYCLFHDEYIINNGFERIDQCLSNCLEIITALPNENVFKANKKLYFDRIAIIQSQLQLYEQLCVITLNDLKEFGAYGQTLNHYYISRIISFRSIQEACNQLQLQPTDDDISKFLDIIPAQLNIILAELDFNISSTDNYLHNTIEVFGILEQLQKNFKKDNHIKSQKWDPKIVYLDIAYSKCRFLLMKVLSRRADLDHSFAFYDRGTFRFIKMKLTDMRTMGCKEFKKFFDLCLKNDFVPDDQVNFSKAKNDFERNLQEEQVDFASALYICKYYRKNPKFPIEEKIKELEALHFKIEKFSPLPSPEHIFNSITHISLQLFVYKTLLRVCTDELQSIVERYKMTTKAIVEAKKIYGKIRVIYSSINDKYSALTEKKLILKDYYHHKLFLQSTIILANLYKPHISTPDQKTNEKNLKRFVMTVRDGMGILSVYRENLKWAATNNYSAVYFPYDQCSLPFIYDDTKRSLFLCSSQVRPVNYYEEGSIRKHLEMQLETLPVDFLVLIRDVDLKRIDNASVQLQDDFVKRINSTTKEIRKQRQEINADLEKSNKKNIQNLGLFVAVFSIFMSSWQNIKLPSIDFAFTISVISTILLGFILLLYLTTTNFMVVDAESNSTKLKLGHTIKFILICGLFFSAFWGTKNLYSEYKSSVSPQTDTSSTMKSPAQDTSRISK